MSDPNPDLPGSGAKRGTGTMLPDEELAIEEQLDRVRQEKRRALEDPGPSWSEWFFYSASKWYVILGYLIVLGWEISYLVPSSHVPLYEVLPVLVGTLYAEFLLYQYLWYRPPYHERSRSTRREKPASRWLQPAPYGRWTEEGAAVRAGKVVINPGQGPDPREFL